MAGKKTDGNGNATGVWAKTVSANGNPSYSHAHTDTDVTLPPAEDAVKVGFGLNYESNATAAPLHPDDMRRVEELYRLSELAVDESASRLVHTLDAVNSKFDNLAKARKESWLAPYGTFRIDRVLNPFARRRANARIDATISNARADATTHWQSQHEDNVAVIVGHREADDLNGYQWSSLRKGNFEGVALWTSRQNRPVE